MSTSSFQPIGSDLPNAVYSFRPIQSSFSCPPALSGHDESEDTESHYKLYSKNLKQPKNSDWNREETEELLQAWGPN